MRQAFKEEVIAYGEHNRGFGILCQSGTDNAPVIVMFNAGLLHRSEPYGLNTELARAAAEVGFDSIRFDLSGKGDTPPREGLSNRESVAQDWLALKGALESRLGKRRYILMGLCSGADNAVKTASTDLDVHGLVLFDPVPPLDAMSSKKQLGAKLKNPWFWLRLPAAVLRRFLGKASDATDDSSSSDDMSHLPEQYQLRDMPTFDELKASIQNVSNKFGSFSFFTSYSFQLYSHLGQMREGLELHGVDPQALTEHYRPDIDHLFSNAQHRSALISFVQNWLTNIDLS